MKTLIIKMDFGRSGYVSSTYILSQEDIDAYKEFLTKHKDHELYLSEPLGKHSEAWVTGQQILDSIEIKEEAATGFTGGSTDLINEFECSVEEKEEENSE